MPVTHESQATLQRLFAMIEASLKRIPEYLQGDEGGSVSADLQRFGRDINDQLDHAVSARSKVVLLTLPPKREIRRNGRPDFEETPTPLQGGQSPKTVGKRLFEASVRVRNNVVHGGKEDPALERYSGHDQAVVDAAIEVLSEARKVLGRITVKH